MASGTIIESVKDAIAVGSNIIESAEKDVAWLVPGPILVFAAEYKLNEKSEALIRRGGRVRGITEISPPYVETINRLIRIGEDVRHAEHYGGASFMLVGDKKQSISSIQVSAEDISLDAKIVAFWSEDPDYAAYLLSSFESAWAGAIDAQKRIQSL
ncbi:MAG: hypothetical protein ACXV4B_08570 [Halobacteriota archaeon]